MNAAYTVSEISARSPDMSENDFRAFVEDVRLNGQLVPIWVRGSEIIDGRKRMAACRELGIEPKIVNLDPEQDAEAVSRALNVLRTHYTPSQRALFAAERVTAERGTSKSRMNICKFADVPIVTAGEAAREAGVHIKSVDNAKRIRREGAPEVVEAVKAGKLTIHAAEQIVNLVPREEQGAAVSRVIEANRGKSRNASTASILTGEDPRAGRSIRKAPAEQFARSVQMLEVAASVVAEQTAAALTDTRRREFVETLRDVRTTITQAIKALEIAA